jgi:hypothetical protein
MKQIFLILSLVVGCLSIIFAQKSNESNGYSDYEEFKNSKPSLTFNFQLKQRSGGDIFMVGGIANYKIRKVDPVTDTEKIEYNIWGIRVGGVDYINSYPYSKLKGYNKIEGKGYYSYFIGEPARIEKEQRELGIIKPNEKQIAVCCQTGYVILPTGKVLNLRPELLLELCEDNEDIINEIKAAKFRLEDVHKMFEILKKYNLSKNQD